MSESKAKTPGTVAVTQIRSANNRPKAQQATLYGLGLRRLNQTSRIVDTVAVRGMIRRVAHLVRVEE